MSESTIAIIGSGIVGSTIAYDLVMKGYDVHVFEKGPDYPYPHHEQYREKTLFLYDSSVYNLPLDQKNLTISGDYLRPLNDERIMVVGGSATKWGAITLRMLPRDFRMKSLYGIGNDWPLSYDDLEPYYCKAESIIGVSGTDEDNPFAPRRSKPYPLPAFEFSYDDLLLAERLKKSRIVLHTTPQARTRKNYGDRPGCANFGVCDVCPIGVRYSPNYHLNKAIQTGLCKLTYNTTIRRIHADSSGRAKLIVYRENDSRVDSEHSAKVVIVAAGAIESARLLLLSKSAEAPNGLGNRDGQVGQSLMFHHLWGGDLHYKELLYPGRFGGWTGQSHQFINPSSLGKHGGIKVEFSSMAVGAVTKEVEWRKGLDIIEDMKSMRQRRKLILHAESSPDSKNFVELSEKKDKFGDPFPHINYQLSHFDFETYHFGKGVFKKFVEATRAESSTLCPVSNYWSGHHHMGTCRMGRDPKSSVVNEYSMVHGIPNLFVVGGSNFVTSSAVNPTLTMVALALRTSDFISEKNHSLR